MSQGKVTLVGAGLAGSYLAILLAQKGFLVEMYEKRSDMRSADIGGGRSINLAISTRGLSALQRIKDQDDLLDDLIPMLGREIHHGDGRVSHQPYSPNPELFINSVSRADLNKKLMNLAEATGQVSIYFDAEVEKVDFSANTMLVNKGGIPEEVEFTTLIGTDGSASAVREAVISSSRGKFNLDKLPYGYKELTMPPTATGDFAIKKNALHIWPRRNFMLIALPNPDASFTCTLFLPTEGGLGFADLKDETAIHNFFKTEFPEVVEFIPNLVDEFLARPVGNLGTVRSEPWYFKDQAIVLGDAAHGIVPFYGQGMNCAFESCYLLMDQLEQSQRDWGAAFEEFFQKRKPDTDAIADLAIRNFTEMQDHVADQSFLLKKAILRGLEERIADFKTEYSLVTFSNCSYALAKEQGEIQAKLVDQLANGIHSVAEVDWHKAEQLVKTELAH